MSDLIVNKSRRLRRWIVTSRVIRHLLLHIHPILHSIVHKLRHAWESLMSRRGRGVLHEARRHHERRPRRRQSVMTRKRQRGDMHARFRWRGNIHIVVRLPIVRQMHVVLRHHSAVALPLLILRILDN